MPLHFMYRFYFTSLETFIFAYHTSFLFHTLYTFPWNPFFYLWGIQSVFQKLNNHGNPYFVHGMFSILKAFKFAYCTTCTA